MKCLQVVENKVEWLTNPNVKNMGKYSASFVGLYPLTIHSKQFSVLKHSDSDSSSYDHNIIT